MSNIIILSLLSLGLVTSFSFIYTIKQKVEFVEFSKLEGSEHLEKREIMVDDFHSIEANDQIQVYLSQGARKVEISAEDNLIESLKVKNSDGVLVIYHEFGEANKVSQNLPMVVRVTSPSFKSLKSYKQSEIIIDGSIKVDNLSILLRDQSKLTGNLEAKELDLSITNQANAHLSGTCEELDVSISEQAGLKGGSLKARTVNISQSNQSKASVFAEKSIKGSVRGNAELTVLGNPEVDDTAVDRNARMNKRKN